MKKHRSLSPLRTLLAAGLLTAGGVVVAPAAAHASTESFSVSVSGGYNNSTALGTASGTITAVNGGTTASYSVTLCGQSTYPSSTVTLTAGGATASHTVYYQACQTFSGTLTSGSAFSSATVKVSGSTFYPGNTYTTYNRTRTVYFSGGVVTPPPTYSPVTGNFSVTVRGGYNAATPLGTATGSITSTRGTYTATYSLTLCGNQTYPTSTVTVTAGGASASHTVNYSNCQAFSGTLTSGSPISTAVIRVSGSTFYPGNTYTTYTSQQTVYF